MFRGIFTLLVFGYLIILVVNIILPSAYYPLFAFPTCITRGCWSPKHSWLWNPFPHFLSLSQRFNTFSNRSTFLELPKPFFHPVNPIFTFTISSLLGCRDRVEALTFAEFIEIFEGQAFLFCRRAEYNRNRWNRLVNNDFYSAWRQNEINIPQSKVKNLWWNQYFHVIVSVLLSRRAEYNANH